VTHGKAMGHRDYRDAAEEACARPPALKGLMRGLVRQAGAPL